MNDSARARARSSRRPGRNPPAVGALVMGLLALLAAGCSSSPSANSPTTTAPSSTTSTSAPGGRATTYSLYFLRASHLGVAHRNAPAADAVATAAVSALMGGPDADEMTAGLTSAIPAGTRLLALRTASGTATVDVSDAFADKESPGDELARVAQVVFTLTQFPSVRIVALQIGGSTPTTFASGAVSLRKALGPGDVVGALPAILVESPAVGDTLHGSVHLAGLANVYEAQFQVQLIDGNGKLLVDEPVQATAGSGTWGTFDATFSFSTSTKTTSTLRVYDVSMKDGSPIDEVDLRLVAGP